jgi:monoamine oxidase
VNWGKIANNLGSWVGRGSNGDYYEGPYKQFITPDDRFYFAGDHCSHVGAWQEGAARAAHRALAMLAERVKAEKLAGAGKSTVV